MYNTFKYKDKVTVIINKNMKNLVFPCLSDVMFGNHSLTYKGVLFLFFLVQKTDFIWCSLKISHTSETARVFIVLVLSLYLCISKVKLL